MGIKNATWIKGADGSQSPIFRKKFNIENIKKCEIEICGLGLFELYVNGKKIGDNEYEPASTSYADNEGNDMKYPLKDKFLNPRIFYLNYDLTDYVKSGENVLSVQLGNGFYAIYMENIKCNKTSFFPMLAFSVLITDEAGNVSEINSDTSVITNDSHIVFNDFYLGEIYDMTKYREWHSVNCDESDFVNAEQIDTPRAELTLYNYPKDKVIRELKPKYIGEFKNQKIYDFGENISGRVCFDTVDGFNGEVVIEHAEELNDDLSLYLNTAGWGNFVSEWDSNGGQAETQIQRFIVRCGGRKYENIHPHFSWQAFRFISIIGEVENLKCEVIHTDIKKTAEFKCENALINKLFDIYVRTQLTNIHGCIPSDCPHRERLGYTGDGQITCETVMTVFDVKEMYRKWMQDIVDCSNKENGHIQHCAPFYSAGGGPSAWGGAVIIVPYIFYKIYGDSELIDKYSQSMKKFLDYLESRCENGFVVREEEGGWCLGDWAYEGYGPYDDIDMTTEYVNTAYLVKLYDYMLELDEKLMLNINIEDYKERQNIHKKAIVDKYYNNETGDFCNNVFAANAFAVNIGLGDERTFLNLVKKYDEFAGLDTGIYATEIMMRLFCERGYTDLVYKLLTSEKEEHSFGYMINQGATTIWEEWNGEHSHNHPMFGGCLKSLWTGFLGIKNIEEGYKKVVISPCDIKDLGNFSGSLMTEKGKISVRFVRKDNEVEIEAEIPSGVEGLILFNGVEKELMAGKNSLIVKAN